MILQALTEYYEALLEKGEISRPGWGPAKVSFGLNLDDDGTLLALLPLRIEQQRGQKSVQGPRVIEVPMATTRTSGVLANFLCDNSGYLLGADDKGNPKRTVECFAASKTLHQELLLGATSPAAKAVRAFFERWDPEKAGSHPALSEQWADVIGGSNLIFWYRDAPVFENAEVRALWQAHYNQIGEGYKVRCLITGKESPLERTHPVIKGIKGAQSSGASLVSFNAPAFESYGHKQGENAPIGTYAAFAYTTALNHLVADREHVEYIGDTAVLCWAQGGESAYQDFGMAALYGNTATEQDIQAALSKLASGDMAAWGDIILDPEMHFFVLGLAPNAARLSIRFFWQDSIGALAKNLQAHYDRLQIVRSAKQGKKPLSVWRLLQETVNQNAREKEPVPHLAGEVLRAVLANGRYPATLLNGVTLRIRAEHEITPGRAAIIKAYYLKNENEKCPKEVLTVELNEQSNYLPYVLGRLFSVLEAVQTDALPGINATIKDKYFNSASANPAVVFPLLINLAQKHLRKLETGKQIYYGKQMTELLGKITETYPARMTLPEQGAFQLGYYHQTQKRFTKKEEK